MDRQSAQRHLNYFTKQLAYEKAQAEELDYTVKWDAATRTVQTFVTDKDFLNLAKEIGTEKTKSIIETIEKNSHNKYFNVTEKMKYAIAKDILEKMIPRLRR
jgi:dihydroneopterin aldolase